MTIYPLVPKIALSIRQLSLIAWTIVATLIGFLFPTQLAIVFLFVVNLKVTPFITPVAPILALSGGYWFAKREGLSSQYQFASLSISLITVGISLFVTKAFYDMSYKTGDSAASDLLTTIEDYCGFGVFVMDGASLSPKLFNQMIIPHSNIQKHSVFGLRWYIIKGLPDGE